MKRAHFHHASTLTESFAPYVGIEKFLSIFWVSDYLAEK